LFTGLLLAASAAMLSLCAALLYRSLGPGRRP
jgi:hypothetical protein